MHFVAYTLAPALAVPEPCGRPAPLGPMLMSHAAMSAADTGTPRCGPCCATAQALASSAIATATALHVDIADLPRCRDVPALDRVVVVPVIRAAVGDELRARRLHVARLVRRAAHQHARAAVPAPRQPEAHHGFRQHRLVELRLCPGLAAIRGDVDAANLAGARPRDAGDLVQPRALHLLRARRRR